MTKNLGNNVVLTVREEPDWPTTPEILARPNDGDIIFHDDKIKFCANGDIFIKGKKTANDIDVVNYIRKILGLSILKKEK